MSVNIVTTDDLENFREQLLRDIHGILEKHGRVRLEKWMKSAEVMEKLSISTSTLQNMRDNGTISYSKLAGILYYDEEEIDAILKNGFVNKKRRGHEDSDL